MPNNGCGHGNKLYHENIRDTLVTACCQQDQQNPFTEMATGITKSLA